MKNSLPIDSLVKELQEIYSLGPGVLRYRMYTDTPFSFYLKRFSLRGKEVLRVINKISENQPLSEDEIVLFRTTQKMWENEILVEWRNYYKRLYFIDKIKGFFRYLSTTYSLFLAIKA